MTQRSSRSTHLAGIALLLLASAMAACGSGAAASTSRGPGGAGRGGGRGGGGGGAVPVVTAPVVREDVPIDIAAIGNVEAFESVSIRSQVTGTIVSVAFREGDTVQKGATLFTVDERPYRALLEQAQANLTRDEALLAQAEAQLAKDAAQAEYSQVSAERTAALNARGIVAKDAADQTQAAADAVRAAVNADRAAVGSARAQLEAQRAAVENARVQLGYCVIRAPIAGRTGSVAVKTGGLVTANTTELTTLAQVSPIYVTFSVPAVHLATIKAHMAQAPLLVDADPQEGEGAAPRGRLAFLDNTVDVATDTIRLKGEFENADSALWPGQFARVTLHLDTVHNAAVVPSEAVQTGQDGQFVFAVKPDSTVEQRRVDIGQRVGDNVVILTGLSVGDTVVTEGQLRLEPGSRIQTAGADGRGGRGTGPGGRGQGPGGRGNRGARGDTGA